MSDQLIKPQTLRGFRDFLPETMMAREELLKHVNTVFQHYGFSPIDTPALEYSEILLGKGGNESDKQLFRFIDQGDRDVAMRFDLTVPFARFAAQYAQQLGTPFKRSHIGKVWRGERPARGRFREFMQCDFDTIGTESTAADLETVLVIHDLLTTLGFENFTIRINHRQVLNGLLDQLNLIEHSVPVLRALDKLAKIGEAAVIKEMGETAGVTPEQGAEILKLCSLEGTASEVLESAKENLANSELGSAGVGVLTGLVQQAIEAGVPESRLAIDLSIARGLDYYTGTIFETFLGDLPEIGSVCSGGRYDNLAGLFTKQKLPGVGASLGLDRLLAAMEELKLIASKSCPSQVMILQFDAQFLGRCYAIARMLQQSGINVEVYPEAKGLGKQFKHAERRQIRFAIIAGEDELSANQVQVKDLQTGQQKAVEISELANTLNSQLSE